MPQSKLKAFFYSLLPKLLVILIGIGFYLLASYCLEGDLKGLVMGIAGGLISIPLVFISYEIWQKKSQKKLNLSVYEFAERKVQTSISAVHSKLELLIQGAFIYFDKGGILIDDSDIENIWIESYQHEQDIDDDLYDDSLLSFERINVFESLTDARYLKFQLSELTLTEELARLEKLLANAFIMERLEDEQVRAIIFLIETISLLEAFFNNHEYVFCRTSINLHGFSIEEMSEQPSLSVLVFREEPTGEPDMLDVKPSHFTEVSSSPLPAYVVNPDYYGILSDLVFDVIDAINQWKTVSNPIFIDYENAQISVL